MCARKSSGVTRMTVSAKPIVGSPRFEPLHIVCRKTSWISSSGESSYILISSRTTFCSLRSSCGIERRVQKHVRQHVERQRHVAVDDFCVIAGRLFVGEGVEVSADAVHRLGDLPRAFGAAFP